jgi:DNA repair ATPase RecN
LWLCIVLLLLPSPIFAQLPSKQLNNIEQRLLAILSYSQKLEDELKSSQRISEEQSRNIEQLLNELGQLQTRLEASRSLLEKYKHRVVELLSIIEQLETRLKALSESFEASEISWEKALNAAEKEIRHQKIKTAITIVIAVLVGASIGYGIKWYQ